MSNFDPADNSPPVPFSSIPASGESGGLPTADWLAGLPPEDWGLAEAKGWKGPADVLKSYRNLEGFMGADKAGRGLVLPRDAEDKEGFEAVYKALGRPDSPEGYEINNWLGDGGGLEINPGFMEAMAGAMHGAGLSTGQARQLTEVWQKTIGSMLAAEHEAYEDEIQAVTREVSSSALESARRGLRAFGLADEERREVGQAIEKALGPRRAVELFARLGARFGEDRPVDGARGSGGFMGSAVDARRRMDQLLSGRAFQERYLSGDQSAIDQITELSKVR